MEAYFEDKRFPVLVLFRRVRIGDAAEPVVVDELNMKLLFVIDVGDRPNHLAVLRFTTPGCAWR